MKSSVFKQYHNANIFLLAPLPSPRSQSCQPGLTPVWSWKGKEERTPRRLGLLQLLHTGTVNGLGHQEGVCLTPKEEAEAEKQNNALQTMTK